MSLHHSGPAQVGPDNRSVRLKGRRLVPLLGRRNNCVRQESVGTEAAESGRLPPCFNTSLPNDAYRVPSQWPEPAPGHNTGKSDRYTLALTALKF